MSFRARLLMTALASLGVGLVALLVVGNVLLSVGTKNQTSSLLRTRAEAVLASVSVHSHRIDVRETANDRALDREAWVFDGPRVVERPAEAGAALDRAATALGRTHHVAERDGPNDVRLRVTPIPRTRGTIVVGTSTAPTERVRREVLLGSIALAALLLALAALAMRSALAAALQPVVAMTAAAEDWGAHDLDRRFDLGPPRDELTGLAATLDHLLARISASRRHEQHFASEVAHEFRTPLAAMRGRAELALAAGPSEGEQAEALRAVVTETERLGAAVDALYAVARQELDPEIAAVDVAALAREFPGVEVRAPADLPAAAGDAEVVRRALAPLVENARRHAREKIVLELAAREHAVEVQVLDDGPGLPAELSERVFEPGVRGPGADGDGVGLGLPLARRLARTCGGDVFARPAEGGCFVLRLPQLGA